jgi:hypothetical protein
MKQVTLTWEGPKEGELADPPEEEVQRRIEDVNGHDRTLVTLDREGEYLAVGGSASQGLVVYVDVGESTEFWQALSPSTSSEDPVIVLAGGQPGEYPARIVVTLEVALTVAVAYAASGERASGATWESS